MSDEMKALANFMPEVAHLLPAAADAWKQPSANRKPMHEPDVEYHTDAEWLAMQDPVTCHECRDLGRVRVRLALGDPEFGKTIPCPTCFGTQATGGVGTQRISEKEFFDRSRIPLTYRHCRLTNWQPQSHQILAMVRGYIDRWPPPKPVMVLAGLPSAGNPHGAGLGKTHLLTAVEHYAWQHYGIVAVFFDARELWLRVRATYDEARKVETEDEICRQLDYSPLAGFDDYSPAVWAELATPAARSFFGRVYNRRYSNGWPTLVSMNGDPGMDPTVDRILDVDRTVLVPFSGSSYRQRTA